MNRYRHNLAVTGRRWRLRLIVLLAIGLPQIALGVTKVNPNPNTAWEENFQKPFHPAGISGLQQTYQGKQVLLADIKRKTGSSNARFDIPLTRGYDYLQLNIASVLGQGYRSAALKMPGTPGDLGGGNKPGLYTYNLMDAYPRLAKRHYAPMALYVAGGRTEQTPVPPGPRFKFTSLRLVKQPTEGVVVKLINGRTLKVGSKMHITVWSTRGTKDATVEFLWPYNKTVNLTDQPYVQLKSVNKAGTKWTADLTVSKLASPNKKMTHSPMGLLLVYAVVVGGKHHELFSSVSYPIQWGK